MPNAYPLQWPEGRERTRIRQEAQFDTKFTDALFGIKKELRLMCAKNVVISTNITLKQNGDPYANQSEPQDRGVAVYFTYNNQQLCFACDRWWKVKDNLQAVRKTIEALRGIKRWGTGDMVQAAFTGFKQIENVTGWRLTLMLTNNCTLEQAEQNYRALAQRFHPDKGGDPKKMSELNLAIQEARKELNK